MFKYILLAAFIACVIAESEDHDAETTLWQMDLRHDGYDSIIETSNHIHQAVHGDKHGNMEGLFSWKDPKGELIEVKYVANENGYQPESKAIPTPPPIPVEILKALEYISTHPAYVEEEHHHHHNDHHDNHHH